MEVAHPCVLKYYELDLRDKGDDQSMMQLFEAYDGLVQTIVLHIKRGQRVLVHCYAGKHRSPAIVLAVLMVLSKESYVHCFTLLKKIWPQISTVYHKSLLMYEHKIQEHNSPLISLTKDSVSSGSNGIREHTDSI